ncbi:MAG: hypothetical protein ACKO4A_03110, partial [Gammaproteobacteria bacterium]
PDLAPQLIYTQVRLAEERAPLVLRSAVTAGVAVDLALRDVLIGLEQLSVKPQLLETVLTQAVTLGITREAALTLIQELRDAGLCT